MALQQNLWDLTPAISHQESEGSQRGWFGPAFRDPRGTWRLTIFDAEPKERVGTKRTNE